MSLPGHIRTTVHSANEEESSHDCSESENLVLPFEKNFSFAANSTDSQGPLLNTATLTEKCVATRVFG
jgi:hypothetical protein